MKAQVDQQLRPAERHGAAWGARSREGAARGGDGGATRAGARRRDAHCGGATGSVERAGAATERPAGRGGSARWNAGRRVKQRKAGGAKHHRGGWDSERDGTHGGNSALAGCVARGRGRERGGRLTNGELARMAVGGAAVPTGTTVALSGGLVPWRSSAVMCMPVCVKEEESRGAAAVYMAWGRTLAGEGREANLALVAGERSEGGVMHSELREDFCA
ncbi:uncharacterized protein LOC133908052 [Phragmites australis]|uniref:uncharacterized protein LOC133908052 n=1 Tax=Phragmites australis TaxID=29695 RepID=UPI002D78481E|nr:uncharacterized protein LOC133908052 [Phragmites australis]